MPRNVRLMQLGASKEIRNSGELVILLTDSSTPDTSDATPYSAVDYQVPPNLSTYTQTPIYAKVTYVESEKVTYDEGGREVNRDVIVTAPIAWQPVMHKASAVQLSDGTVLRKDQEKISEGRDEFIVRYSGVMRIAQ